MGNIYAHCTFIYFGTFKPLHKCHYTHIYGRAVYDLRAEIDMIRQTGLKPVGIEFVVSFRNVLLILPLIHGQSDFLVGTPHL